VVRYRQATRQELDVAVDWAAAEGWNPGLADADAFWAADPSGFVCAEEDGVVIATGSVVSYGGRFGFMGFFIVRPDLRGQGVGRDFWIWRRDTLKARLDPGAAIGMDGVFAMQPFYARGGFVFAHRGLRMAGVGAVAPRAPGLVEAASLPYETIARYDRRHFGFPRDAFLAPWLKAEGGLALAAQRDGALSGLGVVRPCRRGFKIGPLFADDAATADSLYQALAAHADGQPVFLDIPQANPQAVALAARHGLKEEFGCARMYLGPAPDLPWASIYGITTFELG
jgi:GNAT superfamily N-acetyltransferase